MKKILLWAGVLLALMVYTRISNSGLDPIPGITQNSVITKDNNATGSFGAILPKSVKNKISS